jgi:hypothetical protein
VLALASLARTLADLRATQNQQLQSIAAARAAANLADDGAAAAQEKTPVSPGVAFTGQPGVAQRSPVARSASVAAKPTPPSRRGIAPR